jgi:hypothetical protein
VGEHDGGWVIHPACGDTRPVWLGDARSGMFWATTRSWALEDQVSTNAVELPIAVQWRDDSVSTVSKAALS